MSILLTNLEKGASELGITLSGQQLASFTTYAAELVKWNRKINLTSIVLPEEIAIKHFVDSLTLSRYVDIAGKLLDIGSGGGFPAIPLKIISPGAEIVSVDAVEKKILFQRHVVRLLGLGGFSAVHCRAESMLPEYASAFDLVVSRAFADLAEFATMALPLLARDGVIAAMKGRDGKKEAEESAEKLYSAGVKIVAVHEFKLPIINDARSLIILKKMTEKCD